MKKNSEVTGLSILALEFSSESGIGGAQESFFGVTKYLSEKNQVYVAFERRGNLFKQYESFACRAMVLSNLRLRKKRFFLNTFFFIRAFLVLAKIRGIDLIYINRTECAFLARLLKLVYRCNVVCHVRDTKKYSSKMGKIGLGLCDGLIMVSDAQRVEWFGESPKVLNLDVVHNSVDFDRFYLKGIRKGPSKHEIKNIGYLGRIVPTKGIDCVLRALPYLAKEHPLKFVIAGDLSINCDPSYLALLEELLRELGLEKSVMFAGRVDPVQFIHSVDVLVVPSLYEEPFGRTALEALSCGVLVAASDRGGLPEILRGSPSDYRFNPDDPKDVAEKIGNALGHCFDAELPQRLRDYALSNFSTRKQMALVEGILNRYKKN